MLCQALPAQASVGGGSRPSILCAYMSAVLISDLSSVPLSQAGITTTLNSRCSVLAAANSVFGRWDETKGEDNIDFMPTILSRFDMIFIVKDEHNEERDVVSRGCRVHRLGSSQAHGSRGGQTRGLAGVLTIG